MKLIINQPFTIEIQEEETIKGTLAPLTKKQKKEYEDIMQSDMDKSKILQKKAKELDRINDKIKIYTDTSNKKTLNDLFERKYPLEDSIKKLTEDLQKENTPEKAAKTRYEKSIVCETPEMKTRLDELCEQMSYSFILNFIQEDIKEKRGNEIEV